MPMPVSHTPVRPVPEQGTTNCRAHSLGGEAALAGVSPTTTWTPTVRIDLRSDWRREALRTNLWLVPSIEVVGAVVLFFGTYAADRAVYRGDLTVPFWVISGTADAARQILTALAAAVITVVGVVFSIMIVALTLASTQFGPRRAFLDRSPRRCLAGDWS